MTNFEVITIDGIEWYVLARDNDKALLWAKDPLEKRAFDSEGKVIWRDSDLRTYLNGTWLNSKKMLKEKAIETTITTREGFDKETFLTTTDKVFLLSEADLFGTQSSKPAKPEDYTYKGKQLVTNNELKKSVTTLAVYSWLRSPRFNATNVAVVIVSTGALSSYGDASYTTVGVRPALWVNIGKKTNNEVINTLMDELGVEVGEEFDIIGYGCNPHYFDNEGKLIDCDDDVRELVITDLIYKKEKIQKLPRPKQMTKAEIEEKLGYPIEIVEGE